jgi:hypothetical protein
MGYLAGNLGPVFNGCGVLAQQFEIQIKECFASGDSTNLATGSYVRELRPTARMPIDTS